MIRPFSSWISLFVCVALLSGCSPVSFLSSSFSTLNKSSEERGIGGYVSDGEIGTRYGFILFDYDHKLFYYVKTNVYEGRILLTGCVPTEAMQEDAVRLAWQVPGVKAVINELTVGDGPGFSQTAQDKWISTKLNTLLFFNKNVKSRNYEFLVVHGTVYLVGIAHSKEELDHAIEVARGVSGVKKVVSYVRIATKYEHMWRRKFTEKHMNTAEERRESRKDPQKPHKRIHANHRINRE